MKGGYGEVEDFRSVWHGASLILSRPAAAERGLRSAFLAGLGVEDRVLLDDLGAFTARAIDRGIVVFRHGHYQGEFLVAFLAAIFVGRHGHTPMVTVGNS